MSSPRTVSLKGDVATDHVVAVEDVSEEGDATENGVVEEAIGAAIIASVEDIVAGVTCSHFLFTESHFNSAALGLNVFLDMCLL